MTYATTRDTTSGWKFLASRMMPCNELATLSPTASIVSLSRRVKTVASSRAYTMPGLYPEYDTSLLTLDGRCPASIAGLTMITAGLSSGNCDRIASTIAEIEETGNDLCAKLAGCSDYTKPVSETHFRFSRISSIPQALTQSMVHKVLSNSSSEGSGGSSAA